MEICRLLVLSGQLNESTKANTIAYHSSPNPSVKTFKPGTHFGSEKAAIERASASKYEAQEMYVYKVVLSITKPLEIYDEGGVHDLNYLIDAVQSADRKALSGWHIYHIKKIAQEDGEDAAIAAFATALKAQKGYDSLMYTNNTEDEGSLSWVILWPEQAHIIDVQAFS